MKLNVRNAVLLACMACASVVWAQGVTVDDVCASLTAHPVITGTFTQEKRSASIRRPLKSYGTFIFAKEGIVWNVTRPIKGTTIITSDRIVQVQADGKTSVIDSSSNQVFGTVAEMFSALFGGDKDALLRHFSIAESSDASGWKLILVPKDATIAAAMKQFTLAGTGSGKSVRLESLLIEESGTDSILYTFTDQSYKEVLSDEERAYFTTK